MATDFNDQRNPDWNCRPAERKFFLNPDDKIIAGVCGGLAAYFRVDVVLVRIFTVALICGLGIGFWLYILTWIIAPTAYSPMEKCQLRGLECTPENLRRFGGDYR